jgi:hypothetical protein
VAAPRVDVLGMPEGLVAAVSQLDAAQAEVAVGNWQTTGAEGRGHYRSVISQARSRRGSRRRCEVAAKQLIDPLVARTTAVAPGA